VKTKIKKAKKQRGVWPVSPVQRPHSTKKGLKGYVRNNKISGKDVL